MLVGLSRQQRPAVGQRHQANAGTASDGVGRTVMTAFRPKIDSSASGRECCRGRRCINWTTALLMSS